VPTALRAPRTPLAPASYRLVGWCVLVGVFGAFAALAFDFLVDFAQRWLLEAIAGYAPPRAGTLTPSAAVPGWPQRWWLPVVTTLGGLAGGWLVYTWAPEAEGHGTDAAVSAYHRGGEVRTRIPFVKAVASALTIGSGGVAGREGPTAQIAVGLGAITARVLRLRGQERRILMLAAMSAGLAAVFQAPLGMAIFGVEILYAGMVFESEALIYTVISSVTAYALHGFFAGWSPIFSSDRSLISASTLLVCSCLRRRRACGVLANSSVSVMNSIARSSAGSCHRKPVDSAAAVIATFSSPASNSCSDATLGGSMRWSRSSSSRLSRRPSLSATSSTRCGVCSR
jgi:H+/Cl- antiporter ClcA